MAKIRGDWSGQLRRAFKGSAYVYQRGDDIILSAMPTRIKKQKSEKQLAAMDLMRRRSLAVKIMAPELVQHASFYAKGTALMPRDWLFMSMAGRGVSVFMPEEWATGIYSTDGIEGEELLGPRMTPDDFPGLAYNLERLYPMSALNDLTTLLDIFGDQIGTIIFRAPEGWRGLAPGLPGQSLVLGPDGAPAWVAGGGGGGGATFFPVTPDSTNTHSLATKGLTVQTCIPGQALGCLARWSTVTGASYKVAAFLRSGSTLGTKLGETDEWVAAADGYRDHYFPFLEPFDVPAFQDVAYLLTRTGGSPTDALSIVSCTLNTYSWPFGGGLAAIRYASADPQPGDNIGTMFTDAYLVGPVIAFSLTA